MQPSIHRDAPAAGGDFGFGERIDAGEKQRLHHAKMQAVTVRRDAGDVAAGPGAARSAICSLGGRHDGAAAAARRAARRRALAQLHLALANQFQARRSALARAVRRSSGCTRYSRR
jgi:hypothetical protein